MLKRMYTILFTAIIIMCFSVTAFAGTQVYDKNVKSTDQFLVNITKPEGDESTFAKSYVICGNTDQENVTIELYKLDRVAGLYRPFLNTDSESKWEIGSSGIFMKEVELKTSANDVLIVAYKNSDKENKQISKFTITVLQDNVREKIKNGFDRISDVLKSLFKNN